MSSLDCFGLQLMLGAAAVVTASTSNPTRGHCAVITRHFDKDQRLLVLLKGNCLLLVGGGDAPIFCSCHTRPTFFFSSHLDIFQTRNFSPREVVFSFPRSTKKYVLSREFLIR